MGFNLVFEYDDLVTGIWFASFAVNLLPYAISHLVILIKTASRTRNLLKFLRALGSCFCPLQDKKMAGIFNACIAGLALVCFVLGLLVSQPRVPLDMDVMFPKLSGESPTRSWHFWVEM